ncbi:unnamed protein product [Orchesella dallaii]|uniref:Riboflavin transporter n=1 Tax=Orchesella dallaii TaxID=48710 RepID=A0ABP1PTW4_9HEXA
MQRLLHVDVLSVLFGLGTWLCVNGLWVELPLLVQKLPEGWNLPSYLSVVVQIANIGPLLYTMLNTYFPQQVTEKRAIYFVMSFGLTSTILLGLFWDKTTYVAGADHSTALLVLVLFLASVDCSSRVTYLPFMAKFNEIYLTSYFIGEGLSGFLPSIIALAQGVGGNPECRNNTFGNGTEAFTPDPRFSVDVFFYMLFVFTLISAVAFYCMNLEKVMGQAYALSDFAPESKRPGHANNGDRSSISSSGSSCSRSIFEPPRTEPTISGEGDQGDNNNAGRQSGRAALGLLDDGRNDESSLLVGMSKEFFFYLLAMQAVICMLSNGIFPSIQSYSCLPYGNEAYHLAVTLSNMANPAVCMLAFFIPPPNKSSITTTAVLSLLISGYVMTTAILSPSPPLAGETGGEILLILSWIVLVALFTYVRVSIATMLRTRGQAGLFWCGAITQFGSTIGAILAFVVVNYTEVFKPYYPCT